nr:MAG TPA: hypothetical protein [Caudoviricetes sp.]
MRFLDANFISFYFNGVHVNSLSGDCLSHLFLVSIEYYKFTYISRWYIQQKIGDVVVENV